MLHTRSSLFTVFSVFLLGITFSLLSDLSLAQSTAQGSGSGREFSGGNPNSFRQEPPQNPSGSARFGRPSRQGLSGGQGQNISEGARYTPPNSSPPPAPAAPTNTLSPPQTLPLDTSRREPQSPSRSLPSSLNSSLPPLPSEATSPFSSGSFPGSNPPNGNGSSAAKTPVKDGNRHRGMWFLNIRQGSSIRWMGNIHFGSNPSWTTSWEDPSYTRSLRHSSSASSSKTVPSLGLPSKLSVPQPLPSASAPSAPLATSQPSAVRAFRSNSPSGSSPPLSPPLSCREVRWTVTATLQQDQLTLQWTSLRLDRQHPTAPPQTIQWTQQQSMKRLNTWKITPPPASCPDAHAVDSLQVQWMDL